MSNGNEGKNPFLDETLTFEDRLDWLMDAMSMDEKLKCLATVVPDIDRLGIRGFGVGGEAAHGVEARNDQNTLGEPEPSTSFPQPVGMSASWDTELMKLAGEVTGREARVIYHRHPDRGLSRWAPTVDLERDPRWGRTEEGYGEDPFLTGAMAGAYVQGMQGNHPKYLRVAATLKHFYGNNTEVGRGYKSVSIDPRNKMELYLEPFRRVIEDGHAEAVMTAYNKINGTVGMLNHEVREILKKQYGVKHVVCDGGAMELVVNMHQYYGIHAQTLANAVKAGVDGMSDNPAAVEAAAREAYDLKLITEEEIDEALRNMFRTKLRLGIYDSEGSNPYDAVTEEDINSKENQRICRQMSRESIVLLKNDKQTLPLAPLEEAHSVALIGPLADVWYQDWYGGKAPYTKTLKQGIREVTGKEVPCVDGRDRVVFRYGAKGIAAAQDGTLYISDTPDVFIVDDWGEGSYTFQAVRTGKYMNARQPEESNGDTAWIAAERDEPFDWFVMELFHVLQNEDGTIQLTERFGSPVQLDEGGRLYYRRKDGCGAHFRMEVVQSGLESACQLAEGRDTVILALGCNPMINAKEEVDRSTIKLPPAQEQLMDALYQVNPNIVLVLFSNYPYAVCGAQQKLPAIVWSATGSQDMGTAMAETLFGVNAPAGRLNLTWYRDDNQLPDIDDYDIIQGKRTYRYFEGEVLYPFGYGLTYTAFSYEKLTVTIIDGVSLRVSFQVKNTGEAVSDEVAQVYGMAPASRVRKPLKQLIGFERVKNVAPGECRQVTMEIPISEFRFYDVISKTLMVEAGCYQIAVGSSSEEFAQCVSIQLPGKKTGVRDMSLRTAADHYDESVNIYLTQGQFGYTAAAVARQEEEGVLTYRDCCLAEQYQTLILHMINREGGQVQVYINGRKAAECQETAAIYKDVRVKLDAAAMAGADSNQQAVLEIRLSKDVKLCYFRME